MTATLLLAAAWARAAGPPADGPVGVFFEDFCAAPVRAVCETLLTNPLGRNALLLQQARALAAQAAREVGLPPAAQPGVSPAARAQAVGRFHERLTQLLRQRVGQVEWDTVQGASQRVRGLLAEAIDRTFSGNRAQADRLKELLAGVRVLDSSGLRQALTEGRDENAAALSQAYGARCGEEGLAQNAFAVGYTRGAETRRYFIVCPGLLLSSIGGGRDGRSNLENLLFVMGHELSHHFDAAQQPALYASYQRCLAQRHGAALAGPIGPRMGEISADHWGTEVLLGYLAQTERARGMTQRDRLWVLRQGVGALCGSPDDGVHPSGDFRIGVLLRGHGGVIGAMRCAAPPDARACALSGSQIVLTHPERLLGTPR